MFSCKVDCCSLIAHGIDHNILLAYRKSGPESWPQSNYPTPDNYCFPSFTKLLFIKRGAHLASHSGSTLVVRVWHIYLSELWIVSLVLKWGWEHTEKWGRVMKHTHNSHVTCFLFVYIYWKFEMLGGVCFPWYCCLTTTASIYEPLTAGPVIFIT